MTEGERVFRNDGEERVRGRKNQLFATSLGSTEALQPKLFSVSVREESGIPSVEVK